jgi:hypothetical protein
VLFPLVFGSFACSGIGNYIKEPDIQLDHAVVRGIGVSGGTLDLVMKLDNPNNFTLQGTKLEYADDYAVPQNGQTTLTLPLRFGWSGVGSAVRAALSYGDLPYTMKGQATLRLPGGFTKAFSFTHEGRAPLTRVAGSVLRPGS